MGVSAGGTGKRLAAYSPKIVAQAARGDRNVLSELFRDLIPLIEKQARAALFRAGMSGDYHLEDDLVSEAVMSLLEHDENGHSWRLLKWAENPESQFENWVASHTAGWIRNAIRRKRSSARKETDLCDELLASDPGSDAGSQATSTLVRQCLAELPSDYQHALLWRYVDGYRFCEIAKMLDVSVSQAYQLAHRARSRLRSLIMESMQDE